MKLSWRNFSVSREAEHVTLYGKKFWKERREDWTLHWFLYAFRKMQREADGIMTRKN
jgi:hypothetical protein